MNIPDDLTGIPDAHLGNVRDNARKTADWYRTYRPQGEAAREWTPERLAEAVAYHDAGADRAEAEIERRRALIRQGVG